MMLINIFITAIIGMLNIFTFIFVLFSYHHMYVWLLHLIGIIMAGAMIIYWAYITNCWERYGGCPLNILDEVGAKRFFRACRLKYKKKYREAMLVYLGYYPCAILHILYFIYIIITY